ncbi:MAG: FAD-dependent monooxygenase [Xanthobacteraceae bacterium]
MRRTTEIAVIGAGLGGMTVAGLLQRFGYSVKVYEQAPAFSRIGAGIHLSSNVMLVMRRLGIEKTLSDIGLHPDAFVSRKWDTGEILFELPFDPASEAHYGAAYINVHRGDLHAVLESALKPGTVTFGKRLCDIGHSGSTIRLFFAGGDQAEADLVIGADGVHSKAREFLLGPEKPRYTGHIAHRAIFPTALLQGLPIRACTKWWGPGNHILVYYMTQAREEVYIVTSAPQAEWTTDAAFVPCDRDEFVATFDGYHAELRQVVKAAPEVTKWPVFDREPVDQWSGGRMVLLGDACHPLRPYMAAGAAMAIEDAAVLARCIAEIGRDDADESFAWYEANRKPRVAKVQQISMANTWLRTPVDPDWLFRYDACVVPLVAPDTVKGPLS